MKENRTSLILPAAVAVVLAFSGLARGAHDLWAATAVHLAVLSLTAAGVVAAYRRSVAVRLPALGGLLLLLAAWGGSAAVAGDRFDAIFALKDLSAAALMFYLGANAFDDQRSLRTVLCGAVVLLVVQAGFACFQFVAMGAGLEAEAPGALINANVQAAFVVFWLPPLLAEWRRDRSAPAARFWMAGVTAILLILVATQSAAALLCLMLAGFLWASLSTPRPVVRAGLGVIAMAVVALVVWFKITRTYDHADVLMPARTELDRLDWWRTGWEMFLNRPIFGIGPGGYPSAFPAFKVGAGQSTRFAHSLPVTLLAETGLIGVAAAALFAAMWSRGVMAARPYPRLPFLMGAALFLSVTSFGLGGEYLVNQLTLALFLGILAGSSPAFTWKPRLAHAVLATGVALLASPWIISPFLASRLVETAKLDAAANRRDEALVHSASALDLDGTMSEAWEVRSSALWATGSVDAALDAIGTASRLNRYDARLLVLKAKMLASAGREAEAEKEAERAYLLNPRLFPAAPAEVR